MSDTEGWCAFCEIVAGRLEASVAYEDQGTLAFLDKRQPHNGHVLVIPKLHIPSIFDIDVTTGGLLMNAMSVVAQGLRKAFPSDVLSVWQSNGPGAFQEVPHAHFHLMPRHKDDGLLRIYPRHIGDTERPELHRQAGLIRRSIDELKLTRA
jgi:histidine triad (HIT) family protein